MWMRNWETVSDRAVKITVFWHMTPCSLQERSVPIWKVHSSIISELRVSEDGNLHGVFWRFSHKTERAVVIITEFIFKGRICVNWFQQTHLKPDEWLLIQISLRKVTESKPKKEIFQIYLISFSFVFSLTFSDVFVLNYRLSLVKFNPWCGTN